MQFVTDVIGGFLQVVLGLGVVLAVALVSLIIIRALPAVLRAGWALSKVAGRIVGEIVAAALRCLTSIAGSLVRCAIVAGAILAGVHTGPVVWTAYGADLPALIPAMLTIALPFGAVFTFDPPMGRTFGALVAWSAVVVLIGAAAAALSQVGRSILLVGVLTTITAYTQLTGESHETGQE